jgi:hypothetical protein
MSKWFTGDRNVGSVERGERGGTRFPFFALSPPFIHKGSDENADDCGCGHKNIDYDHCRYHSKFSEEREEYWTGLQKYHESIRAHDDIPLKLYIALGRHAIEFTSRINELDETLAKLTRGALKARVSLDETLAKLTRGALKAREDYEISLALIAEGEVRNMNDRAMAKLNHDHKVEKTTMEHDHKVEVTQLLSDQRKSR